MLAEERHSPNEYVFEFYSTLLNVSDLWYFLPLSQIIGERIQLNSTTLPVSPSTLSTTPSPANAPSYQLAISYVRSTNGGKSLLAKGRTKASQSYSAFFDEKGTMNQVLFERWVGELVEQGMDGKLA